MIQNSRADRDNVVRMAHHPVLVNEILEYLRPDKGQIIVDATAGGGGHSAEIIKRIMPGGRLVAIDKDNEAVERVKARFRDHGASVTCVNGDFANIRDILEVLRIKNIDGGIFDLGFSSYHVDHPERGFSFQKEGPLDMRFDRKQALSAWEVVNRYKQFELEDIIKTYGEERHSKLIAGKICSYRKKKRINTTLELAALINDAVGYRYRRQRINPAARTFQALRIFVNGELESAETGINNAIGCLKPGGRVCVVSFHSLEDRLVKNIFRDKKRQGEIDLVTRKPVCPGQEEIRKNPRARSSKMRVAEKKYVGI